MRPDGSVTDVKLLDISEVHDSHTFGLRQVSESVLSPVTGQAVAVIWPILHIEGQREDLFRGGTGLQPD
jgi:hypothetical protein